MRTIENRVRNETAGIHGLAVNRSDRLAITLVKIARANKISLQLVHIDALYISSMVLEEVGQLVVEQHGVIQVVWDVKLNDALFLLADIDA